MSVLQDRFKGIPLTIALNRSQFLLKTYSKYQLKEIETRNNPKTRRKDNWNCCFFYPKVSISKIFKKKKTWKVLQCNVTCLRIAFASAKVGLICHLIYRFFWTLTIFFWWGQENIFLEGKKKFSSPSKKL